VGWWIVHRQDSEKTSYLDIIISARISEHLYYTLPYIIPLYHTFEQHIPASHHINHHHKMSSRISSTPVAQDDRRSSTSSYRSLKGALQWFTEKMTEKDHSEQARRCSYEGLMPSPYETTLAYHARMNAKKDREFW
jgi:hypothetical protein